MKTTTNRYLKYQYTLTVLPISIGKNLYSKDYESALGGTKFFNYPQLKQIHSNIKYILGPLLCRTKPVTCIVNIPWKQANDMQEKGEKYSN